MKLTPFFALDQSFLDPQKTKEGKPYGPARFKQLVQECYIISKNCNTSYSDVLDISPLERSYILQFILEEAQSKQEAVDKAKAQQNSKHQRKP